MRATLFLASLRGFWRRSDVAPPCDEAPRRRRCGPFVSGGALRKPWGGGGQEAGGRDHGGAGGELAEGVGQGAAHRLEATGRAF